MAVLLCSKTISSEKKLKVNTIKLKLCSAVTSSAPNVHCTSAAWCLVSQMSYGLFLGSVPLLGVVCMSSSRDIKEIFFLATECTITFSICCPANLKEHHGYLGLLASFAPFKNSTAFLTLSLSQTGDRASWTRVSQETKS